MRQTQLKQTEKQALPQKPLIKSVFFEHHLLWSNIYFLNSNQGVIQIWFKISLHLSVVQGSSMLTHMFGQVWAFGVNIIPVKK